MQKLLQLFGFVFLIILCFPSRSQTASLVATPHNGCAPLTVYFTNTSTGNVLGLQWNLGNGTQTTNLNPSTTYSAPGSYYVMLLVSRPGIVDTVRDTIIIYEKPSPSFTANSLKGCAPHPAQFNANVSANAYGAVTYHWNFGDGTTDTGASPNHIFTTGGSYTITLTATNAHGCDSTIYKSNNIIADPQPLPNITNAPSAFCSAPGFVSFSSSVSSGTGPFLFSWNFGDGNTSVGAAPSNTYTTNGAYNVHLLVVDHNGCMDSLSKNNFVTVNDTPATFSKPPLFCNGVTYSFYNTSPKQLAAHWDFGDGDTAFGSSATHIYYTGVYFLRMTTRVGNCLKTATDTIVVHSLPTGIITQSPLIPCPAPSLVTFTANSTNSTQYHWSWQSGGIDSGQTVTKNYSQYVYNDVLTLTMTGPEGCLGVVQKTDIRVRDLCVLVDPSNIPFVGGCVPFPVTLSIRLMTTVPGPLGCTEQYPATITSSFWNLDNGNTSNLLSPSTVYPLIKLYIPTVSITTSNNCSGTGATWIHPDTPIPPSFYISPLVYCPKEPISFINTSQPGTGSAFTWDIMGDTMLSTIDTNRLIYGIKRPGVYTIKLISDHHGCLDTFVQHQLITIHPPQGGFTVNIHCPPSKSVTFTNTSVYADSYIWYFGDGTSDTATNPTHSYNDTGNYSVTLLAHNNSYGCTDTIHWVVRIDNSILSISASDTSACIWDPIIFTGTSSYPIVSMFSFIFDHFAQTSFNSAATSYHSFDSAGYHDITLVASYANGCKDTLDWPTKVLIGGSVVKILASSNIGCDPMTVTLRDSIINPAHIPIVSRIWTPEWGDTVVGNLSTIIHTYHPVGYYFTRLVVTDSLGCVGAFAKDSFISVNHPIAGIQVSRDSPCIAEPMMVVDTSYGRAPLTYQWIFGDGTTDTMKTPHHAFASTGTFASKLIVTDSVGCQDSISHNFLVYKPSAAFSLNDSLAICPPLSVQFTNHSSGASHYSWNFSNGSGTVIIANPIGSFNNPGVYPIYQVAINAGGCTDTAWSQVKVLGYNGAITYTPLQGCLPLSVHFNPPALGIPKITWDFGDGQTNITNGTDTTHIYTTAGAFLPKVIFSDGAACQAFSIGIDTIHIDQVHSDFNWSVPCVGVPFSLSNTSWGLYSNPSKWLWWFDAKDSVSVKNPNYSFSSAGNHQVRLVSRNTLGCLDTLSKQIYINLLPIIITSVDTAVCPGDTAHIWVMGAKTYSWSPANLINCLNTVCDSAFVAPTGPTVYTVTGIDSNGCFNQDSTRVIIQIKTTDSTGPGGAICVGQSYQLHAGGAQHYEWSPAATLDNPHISNPIATPLITTTYTLSAQEGTCLIAYTDVTVVVNPLPIFSAGMDETMIRGSAVTLHPTKDGIDHIIWKSDTTLSCLDCFLPNAHPRYTHTYYATAYDANGCWSTDSVTVFVRCNGNLVFIPNSFSPNGDGNNDVFYPRGEGVDQMTSFQIYNRWGQLVFERNNVSLNDASSGWDGNFQGQALAPDVYVYTMTSRCEDASIVRWKGDITLMR